MGEVSIRQEAETRFLGRDHVVGVGLAQEGLVFLLDLPSPSVELQITRWAQQRGVSFTFRVVPSLRPA